MSSCWGSVCLLVVLGVVFASGSPCHFVSENLTQTHNIVADALGLKETDVGKKGLFSPVVNSITNSHQKKEQVQLMNATLDVYMQIFSSILQHNCSQNDDETLLNQVTPDGRPRVEGALRRLREKMGMLKFRLKHDREHHIHDKENVMGTLNNIRVDNIVDQKTALAEYKEVYQAAAVIISPHCELGNASHRRRRR